MPRSPTDAASRNPACAEPDVEAGSDANATPERVPWTSLAQPRRRERCARDRTYSQLLECSAGGVMGHDDALPLAQIRFHGECAD